MRVPRTRLVRAEPRRPTLRALLVSMLAGSLVLAACTTTVTGRGSPAPLVLPEPIETGGPSSTATAAPTSASPQPSGPPSHATLGSVSFDVPGGWVVDKRSSSACVRAPGVAAGTCTLLVVDIPKAQVEHQVARAPDPKAPQGWWLGSGSPACATNPRVPATGSELVGSGFVKMRNKTSAYGTWLVHCADPNLNFSPRLWWLPRTQVAFLQERGGGTVDAQVDRVVASVSVT